MFYAAHCNIEVVVATKTMRRLSRLSAACLCVVGCCGVARADSAAAAGHGGGGAPHSGLAARLQQYFERDWLSLALAFESRPGGSRCGAAPP